MDQPNDTHPMQKAAELHLLAHVLELGHLTTPAIFMPIPMTRGDKVQRFIFSGTRAEVEKMLKMVPHALPAGAIADTMDHAQLDALGAHEPLKGAVVAGPESIRPAPGETRPPVERRRYPESGME